MRAPTGKSEQDSKKGWSPKIYGVRFWMQEETGVPGGNLRGRVWIGNQTHLRT